MKYTDSVKDLGIIVDHKFKFIDHCEKVIKRTSYLSKYSVLRIFKLCDFKTKYFIFKTYILPIILYNIEFYYPTTYNLKKSVESVQRRFSKRICPPGMSYAERLMLLSDVSIEYKHKLLTLSYMYKLLFLLAYQSMDSIIFQYIVRQEVPCRNFFFRSVVLTYVNTLHFCALFLYGINSIRTILICPL